MVSSRPENRRNYLHLEDAKDVYCRRVLTLRFLLNFFVHLLHNGVTMENTPRVNDKYCTRTTSTIVEYTRAQWERAIKFSEKEA